MTSTGSTVFISYRATDSGSYGALLYFELARHFGRESVFFDSESIPAGADCVETIRTSLRRARVLLAVIGPDWLIGSAAGHARDIDNPADWIRLEISEALSTGIKIIPVLIDEARLPTADELPEDIRSLNRCQYRLLRHRHASPDLRRLVADLRNDPVLAAAFRRRRPPRPLSRSVVHASAVFAGSRVVRMVTRRFGWQAVIGRRLRCESCGLAGHRTPGPGVRAGSTASRSPTATRLPR